MATNSMWRTFKCLRLINFNNTSSTISCSDKFNKNLCKNLHQCRLISCSIKCRNVETEEEQKKKKKTQRIPKITLFYDNTMTVMDMENAQKLAKRRNLNLIRVADLEGKSERVTYKLISSKDYADEQIEDDTVESDETHKTIKSLKLFPIHSKISNNDLLIKIKHMNKVLKKMHQVRIVISYNDNSAENVINTIKSQIEGEIVQIVAKQGSTICMVEPILNVTATKEVSKAQSLERENHKTK